MNSDLVGFYYLTKHASSISGREKEASVKEQDEKIAADLRQIASSFAKNHPKAVENAITGGILGGGSELVLPANKDMMGNPSTNLGEIGKRALLGATLGGIGGEVKTRVRNHVLPKIAQENTEKIAGKFDKLKQFAGNNAGALIGAGTLGTIGASSGYGAETVDRKGNFVEPSKGQKIRNAVHGGLSGAVVGGLTGSGLDRIIKLPESITNEAMKRFGKGTKVIKNPIKIPKSGITLPKDKGKLLNLPIGQKPKSNPIPKTDKSPKGTIVQFPTPEKTAGIFDIAKKLAPAAGIRGAVTAGQQLAPSSLLQTAGKYMAKSPTVGGAVIGAGAGLTGNFLSGEDHAVGSALAGAGLGALGGKKLLVGNASKSPLFGQSFGTGVRNELKAGLKAKPVVSSPITSPSLQNAPSLNSLVNDAKGAKPVVAPTMPKRPESIEW